MGDGIQQDEARPYKKRCHRHAGAFSARKTLLRIGIEARISRKESLVLNFSAIRVSRTKLPTFLMASPLYIHAD